MVGAGRSIRRQRNANFLCNVFALADTPIEDNDQKGKPLFWFKQQPLTGEESTMNTLQAMFRRTTNWQRLALAALTLTMLFTSPSLSRKAAAAGWEPLLDGEAGFKVVSFTTRHFGDNAGASFGNYPFPAKVYVGNDFTYPDFDLPGLDGTKGAVVMVRTMDVSHHRNIFEVNGNILVNGPLAAHQENLDNWFTQMVEIPSGILKATGNKLRIQSLASDGSLSGGIDDFLVDTVVVIYSR
jgi:hypothetical protein